MPNLLSRLFSINKKRSTAALRKGEPEVFSIPNGDEGINWAIEKARLTLHYFIEILNAGNKISRYVSAKVKISDGQHTEHIWLNELEFDVEGNLFGAVGNIPMSITNVHLGQRVGIENTMITDWMIVENGRLIGGYTIRAIRDKITDKEELRRFDEELGNILIDEGEDYFLPNFETPEGAILCIEKAYDEGDLDKILSCKDFNEEAKLMLHRNGMLERLREEQKKELVATVAETLQLSLIKEVQDNGMPNFRNCKRAFPVREKLSKVHWVITEVVYHPDGSKSSQRINTYRTESGWRVLNSE